MKIGYLGPAGTYTERALELYNSEAEKIVLPNIPQVFEALKSKKVDLGFVPLENVIQGPVTETLDSLFLYSPEIQIVDAIMLDIRHALGALPEHNEIKRIMSKDTALSQCSKFPHLYGVMLRQNPHALSALKTFQKKLEEIVTALEQGKDNIFEEMMKHNAKMLGEKFIVEKTDASKQVENILKKKS